MTHTELLIIADITVANIERDIDTAMADPCMDAIVAGVRTANASRDRCWTV